VTVRQAGSLDTRESAGQLGEVGSGIQHQALTLVPLLVRSYAMDASMKADLKVTVLRAGTLRRSWPA
jgi:hypothetical protein